MAERQASDDALRSTDAAFIFDSINHHTSVSIVTSPMLCLPSTMIRQQQRRWHSALLK